MSTSHTEAPFELSEDRRVKGPLKFWIALLVSVAVAATAWAWNGFAVANHSKRIDDVEGVQREQARTILDMRIMLERIDTNVSALKEAKASSLH